MYNVSEKLTASNYKVEDDLKSHMLGNTPKDVSSFTVLLLLLLLLLLGRRIADPSGRAV